MATGLGRGLDSLIPKKIKSVGVSSTGDAIVNVSSDDEKNRILQIKPDDISVNPYQPRKRFTDNQLNELVDSIKNYGIIQPLIVTKKDEGGYELIAGERRLRSSKVLNLEKVPVIVREADKQEKLELALIENIQREQLNPIETAVAYRKLVDEFNLTQDALSERVGKSRSSVANTIRLLNLPEKIQESLAEGAITEGHGKILLGIDNEVQRMALYRRIMHDNLSVSTSSSESKKYTLPKKEKSVNINYKDKDKEFLFREFFGAKVNINRKGNGGEVIIHFFSDDELNELANKIK